MKYTVHYNGKFSEDDNELSNERHFMVFREAMEFLRKVIDAGIDDTAYLVNNWDGTKMKWDPIGQSLYWSSH